jgi:hypothetical protein
VTRHPTDDTGMNGTCMNDTWGELTRDSFDERCRVTGP